MNDRTIVKLRADSLRSVLAAARFRRLRRLRRGVIAVLGSAAALALILILLLPARFPERDSIKESTVNFAPAQPVVHAGSKPPHIIRTTSGSLLRISTASKTSLIRLKTSPAADVPRIDTPSLAGWFPGKGIAVIHGDAEPSRAVFF